MPTFMQYTMALHTANASDVERSSAMGRLRGALALQAIPTQANPESFKELFKINGSKYNKWNQWNNLL